MEPLNAETYRIGSAIYRRNVPVDRIYDGDHSDKSRIIVDQAEEDEDAFDECADGAETTTSTMNTAAPNDVASEG